MEVQAFQYIRTQGWSTDKFPDLDSENTLILVFAAPIFFTELDPIQQLAKFYTKSKIMGCSTAGEIYGKDIFDESISIVVIKFAHTIVKIAKATVTTIDDSYASGELIGNQLKADDLRSIFVLSNGLKVNGSALVRGLNKTVWGKDIVITGGLAGDGANFNKTWVLMNNELFENHVIAVGLYSKKLCVGHASQGGWDIFGPVRRITRSKGNILYELDYKPALDLYKEYLGDKAIHLPASGLLYPLSISDPSSKESIKLVRTILAIDENTKSLIFAGDTPQGFNAQLMRANFDRLIESASEASLMANERMFINECDKKGPVVAICISCVGRRLLLGERTEEETEATLNSLPEGTTQIGLYSYGELSPYAAGGCELHNQTMTITTFSEI